MSNNNSDSDTAQDQLNLKKAYRLFVDKVDDFGQYKKNIVESALILGLPISAQTALHPANQKVFQRNRFWESLKSKIERTLKIKIIQYLRKSGGLYIDQVFLVGTEFETRVVDIRFDGFSVKESCDRRVPKNILFYRPLTMVDLPGEDPEGEVFWNERKLINM